MCVLLLAGQLYFGLKRALRKREGTGLVSEAATT
jgi:hypothetical protein